MDLEGLSKPVRGRRCVKSEVLQQRMIFLDAKAGRDNLIGLDLGLSLERAGLEAERCLVCKTTSCIDACSFGNDIPRDLKVMMEGMDALSNALRAKIDFLNTLSHDLRTPLNVIMGSIDLIKEGFSGSLTPELKKNVDLIGRNSEDLLAMLNQVLSLSRLEASGVSPHMEKFGLGDLVSDLGTNISVLAHAKGLEFKWGVKGDCLVQSDPHKIKELLSNLLTNAIKYTEKGGVSLWAGVESEGDQIWLEVADTGRGIPEEELPYIFEPFRQTGPSSAHRQGGVGLGLAIVRRLLDLLKGRIEVKSTLNEGSTFKVILPRLGPQTK